MAENIDHDHEDSVSVHDSNTKKTKNRRPANTAFRQQRLKAWQPILTPKTVIPLFLIIGIVFAPVGGGLLYINSTVNEIQIDYSACASDAPIGEFAPMPDGAVKWSATDSRQPNTAQWLRQKDVNITFLPGEPFTTTQCIIQFYNPVELKPPVLFYYRLTNFYQNHRRYVKSFNSDQLKGTASSNSDLAKSASCDPLTFDPLSNYTKPYYPCGLIANSIFNDTFYSPILLDTTDGTLNKTYVMNNSSGISWDSDKDLYGPTQYNYSQISPPPNWQKKWPHGYSAQYPPPNPAADAQFQVWMRTAGLPTFSKLAQRNDTASMEKGMYQISIDQNFPVSEYGGTKSVLISTRTAMGGRNPFLGIAYVVVGGVCTTLGIIFTIAHLVRPRKLGDHTYLSWNKEGPSTATATGREFRAEAR